MDKEQTAHALLAALGLLRPGWFPTFLEFTESIPDKVIQHIQAQGGGHADCTALAERLHSRCVYSNAGSPRFVIRPNLARLLVETDLPEDMSTEWLRLPYEGLCLEVPINTFGPPAEKATELYMSFVPGDRLRLVFSPDLTMTHYVSLTVDGQKSIAAAIAETKARAEMMLPAHLSAEYHANDAYNDYFRSDVFTFALNAVLYITSGGADVVQDKAEARALHQQLQGLKQKAKREKLEARLLAAKDKKIYICGECLVAPREMTAELTKEGRS